jgi:thiamine biosynthesis lipoprotein
MRLLNVLGLICTLILTVEASAKTNGQLLPKDIQFFEGQAQGTTFHITYRAAKKSSKLEAKANQSLKDFDKVFSNYRPDSAISIYNASTSTDWVSVPAELAQLLSDSLEISRQTQGSFDVTIGAVLKVWGFGPYKKAAQSVPGDKDIADALLKSGFDKVEVRLKPAAIKKKFPELAIDLSGVAQGASVDVLASLFDKEKIDNYIIEVGGEMMTKGERSKGKPWVVAIESPTDSPGSIAQTVAPKGLGMSTSGDYRNYFEQKGKRYSHIFDPRVGRPIESKVASSTVLAKTAREADAYAKAYMILNEAEGKALAARLKMPVFLMNHMETGFSSIYYEDFEAYLVRM